MLILASAIGNARAQTAADVLAEADRLAWLKNWSRAEPLFSKADEMFTAAGDERNALYSRISAIRGRLPRLSLIEVSQTLSDYLGNPIVQNDTKLKLRCLVVKGDVDMDFDDGLAQEDWTAALSLAKSLKDPDWEARATGELGIISFLQGDHSGAVMSIGNALIPCDQERRYWGTDPIPDIDRKWLNGVRAPRAGARILGPRAEGRGIDSGFGGSSHDVHREGACPGCGRPGAGGNQDSYRPC